MPRHRKNPGSLNPPGTFRYKANINKSAATHGKKRLVLSYIYLLLLKQVTEAGHIPANTQLKKVSASLQAGGAGHGNEAAHQLLREVGFSAPLGAGIEYPYDIVEMPQDMRAALIYCTSATSDIEKKYNTADSQLEVCIQFDFLALAQRCVSDARPADTAIWDRLVQIFNAACDAACIRAENRSRDVTNPILNSYKADAISLNGNSGTITGKSVAHWITLIRDNGMDVVVGDR